MVRFASKKTGEVWFEGVRVSNRMPCPICASLHQNQGWCLLDPTRGIAICPRVESPKRIGDAGWLHHLDNTGSIRSSGCFVTSHVPEPSRLPDIDKMWSRAAEAGYREPETVFALASKWGINRDYLEAMEIGIMGKAWAFAMRDKAGMVCGIKLRTFDGRKLCVRGSRLGYITPYPQTWRKAPEVYVTEGESDLAAAVAMGLPAIARPGCSSLVRFMPKLLTGRHVVIIRDNDDAGKSGAALLRNALDPVVASCVVVSPRYESKDLREWFQKGATADDIRCIVKALRGW